MRALQVALLLSIAGPIATNAFAGAQDMALCAKMSEGWQAAFNAKDATKLGALYDASGSRYSSAFWTAEGREAIEGGLKQEIASGIHFSEIKCVQAYNKGALHVGFGTWAASTPGPDGKTMNVTGHWLSTVKEDHGTYLIVDHTSNMQMPPPH